MSDERKLHHIGESRDNVAHGAGSAAEAGPAPLFRPELPRMTVADVVSAVVDNEAAALGRELCRLHGIVARVSGLLSERAKSDKSLRPYAEWLDQEYEAFMAGRAADRPDEHEMCVDCRVEEATSPNGRCRDCDIDFCRSLLCCEHCGRHTNVNDLGVLIGFPREQHAEDCPKRSQP